LYGISILALLLGICVGAIFANYMNYIQNQELINYMNNFFMGFPDRNISYLDILKQSILSHGRTIALLWVFGLGVVGIPLAFLVVFAKGFSYGFTSSFLLIHYGFDGFIFSLTSFLPQSIILIPGIIFVSAASMNFAVANYKSNQKYFKERRGKWMDYGLVLLIGILIIILTGFIETFISPLFMKMIMNNMIN